MISRACGNPVLHSTLYHSAAHHSPNYATLITHILHTNSCNLAYIYHNAAVFACGLCNLLYSKAWSSQN